MLNSILRLTRSYPSIRLELLLILLGFLLALRTGWLLHPLYGQSAASPQASFQLIENFDGLTTGALNGRNGWQATTGVNVVTDPTNAANRVMELPVGNLQAYKALSSAIANSSMGTLHFRLRRAGHISGFAGLSDQSAPVDWSSYEAQFGTQTEHAANEFIVRDGGAFDVLGGSFNDQSWYCIWMVANNSNDTYQIYAKGGALASPTQLNASGQVNFSFRNGGADSLLTFLTRVDTKSQGTLYIDDIYVDPTSQNLANPSNNCDMISAALGWQQTPLTLQAGNQFKIVYTGGTWTVDYRNLPYIGPSGYPSNTDSGIWPGCKFDAASPYAMLLGQVGSGTVFPIGLGGTFTANSNGILSLRINDQDGCLGDNDGSIGLEITKVQILPPSAEFDAWPQSGTEPLTVAMHIVSTVNMTSCAWDYGDGKTGTSCASYHDHVYSAAGTYTVRLTASGPGGSNTQTRANYITVYPPANQPPQVSISSPLNGATFAAGSTLTIQASVSDSDGTIAQVAFYANGAAIANCVDSSAPYQCIWMPAGGSYRLTAQATDNLGGIATSAEVIVTVNQAATVQFARSSYSTNESAGAANIQVTLSQAATLPITVNYATSNGTASAGSDYAAANGTLTFNPGESSKSFPITIFDDALDEPNETLSLTLSNPTNATLGLASSATLTIVDNDEPIPAPSAEFDAWPQSGVAPLTVAMHIVSTDNLSFCAWDYGDGTAGSSCEAYHNHTYSRGGTYSVRLSVSGPGGSNSKTIPNYIQVSTPAPANPPSLALDNVSAEVGSRVAMPLSFNANSNAISALLFAVNYDQSKLRFNPVDSNGSDCAPDAIQFESSIPAAFIKCVDFDANDADGELKFRIADFSSSPANIPSGRVGWITLDVLSTSSVGSAATVSFAENSFGSRTGDIPGTASSATVTITGGAPIGDSRKVFLPLVGR